MSFHQYRNVAIYVYIEYASVSQYNSVHGRFYKFPESNWLNTANNGPRQQSDVAH